MSLAFACPEVQTTASTGYGVAGDQFDRSRTGALPVALNPTGKELPALRSEESFEHRPVGIAIPFSEQEFHTLLDSPLDLIPQ